MDIETQRWRQASTEEILKSFSSALRNRTLYPGQHPIVEASCRRLSEKVGESAQRGSDSWTIVLLGGEFVFEKVPLPKISALVRPLYQALAERQIESLTLHKGVTSEELATLLSLLLDDDPLWKRGGEAEALLAAKGLKNVAIKRVVLERDVAAGSTDTEEARDIYTSLRRSLTGFFVSLFDRKKTPSLGVIDVLVERVAAAMESDRFAMISRLHTRHPVNDLIAHSLNTALISYATAEALGLERDLLRDVALAGMLHDIGLMDIPPRFADRVLLSSEDKRVYLEHPIRGVGILRSIPSVPALCEVVAFEHHMQHDGKGFPQVKQPRPQHPASSIVALASSYDRLMQGERYVPPEEIPARLIRLSGIEFEPAVLAGMILALGVYPPGTYVKLSSGDTALVTAAGNTDVLRPMVKLLSGSDGLEYLEEQTLDLNERDPSSGQFRNSIMHSIPPEKLAL